MTSSRKSRPRQTLCRDTMTIDWAVVGSPFSGIATASAKCFVMLSSGHICNNVLFHGLLYVPLSASSLYFKMIWASLVSSRPSKLLVWPINIWHTAKRGGRLLLTRVTKVTGYGPAYSHSVPMSSNLKNNRWGAQIPESWLIVCPTWGGRLLRHGGARAPGGKAHRPADSAIRERERERERTISQMYILYQSFTRLAETRLTQHILNVLSIHEFTLT